MIFGISNFSSVMANPSSMVGQYDCTTELPPGLLAKERSRTYGALLPHKTHEDLVAQQSPAPGEP